MPKSPVTCRGALLGIALFLSIAPPACRRDQPRPGFGAQPQAQATPPEPVNFLRVAESKDHHRRLLRGLAPNDEWAWASPKAAVSLDVPSSGGGVFLELDFAYPIEVAGSHPAVRLTARVNGTEVCAKSYTAGRHVLSCEVPKGALARSPAEVEIAADVSSLVEGSPRSFILASIGLVEPEQRADYQAGQMQKAREAYARLLERTRHKIPPTKARETTRLYFDTMAWQSMWFGDMEILKNPLDLWMVQQIIFEVKPDYIVETGTLHGGSALYYAHTLHGFGMEKARVITIDILDSRKATSLKPLWNRYVEFVLGSSVDPKVVASIAGRVKGKKVLVALDSEHTMTHVLKEMKLYGPMVSRGSYMIVEDTHLDGVPTNTGLGPGPMAAVRRYLAEGGSHEFEQDFSRETLLMSFNPGGWLRKK